MFVQFNPLVLCKDYSDNYEIIVFLAATFL